MKTPLLFLDFDGVLVTFHKPSGRLAKPNVDCVAQLNRITDETGARIVVSSSWRIDSMPKYVVDKLKEWNVSGDVIGQTPWIERHNGHYLEHADRGTEIMAWLVAHDKVYGPIVILDDESDMGPLLPHLVQTTFEGGLTRHLAQRAIDHLKSSS